MNINNAKYWMTYTPPCPCNAGRWVKLMYSNGSILQTQSPASTEWFGVRQWRYLDEQEISEIPEIYKGVIDEH